MMKLFSGVIVAGALALSMGTAAQAQNSTMKKVLSGEPAALPKAMTQSQARKACRMEMGRKAGKTKMNFCINEKMQGN